MERKYHDRQAGSGTANMVYITMDFMEALLDLNAPPAVIDFLLDNFVVI